MSKEMADKSVYGKHSTLLTTIKNTAMASWSGFVYQGNCALYHALKLLKDNWNASRSKYLSLEAYEDFAILDSSCKIESLHQCKCIAIPTNFTNECKKMEDKHDYWQKEENMLSSTFKYMYFHSNQDNILDCGVVAYPFSSGVTKCDPFFIYAKIETLVGEILSSRRLAGSSRIKTEKLINLISQHVSYIHKKCIDNPGNAFSIAASMPIPINAIAGILENPTEEYSKDERIETCRHFLLMALSARAMVKPHIDRVKIESFIKKVESLSHLEIQNFVRRIFPDIDITAQDFNISDITNRDRADVLFNVINRINMPMSIDTLDWKDIHGDRQSPSILARGKDPEEYCADIVNNPYSSDLRRDYRWIIGDFEHPVVDIEEGAKLITGVVATDYTDVTQTNRIGLKDITTKNNEDNA